MEKRVAGTPESSSRGREAALAKRRENASRLRADFHPDDKRRWEKLAKAAEVTLPRYFTTPVTPGALERWLRQLKIPVVEYLSYEEASSLKEVAERFDSDCWPLKAAVGLLLDYLEQKGKLEVAPTEEEQPILYPVHCRKCGKYWGAFLPSMEVWTPCCAVWNKPAMQPTTQKDAA